MSKNTADRKTYEVYARGQTIPWDVIQRAIGDGFRDYDDQNKTLTVSSACHHDHDGNYTVDGYKFVIRKRPPKAADVVMRITSEWLKYFNDQGGDHEADILTPISKQYGSIEFKDSCYIVTCDVTDGPEVLKYIERKLNGVIQRENSQFFDGNDTKEAKALKASQRNGARQLETQSLKVNKEIWTYLHEKVASISCQFDQSQVHGNCDGNEVTVDITAPVTQLKPLFQEIQSLVDGVSAEEITVDFKHHQVWTDIDKVRKKYSELSIKECQSKSCLLIIGPKSLVQRITENPQKLFPVPRHKKGIEETPMEHDGENEKSEGSNLVTFTSGPFQWMKADGQKLTLTLKSNFMVVLYQGNLMEAKADIIVSSANKDLSCDRGIAKVLANAAGPVLVNGCKRFIERKGPLELGSVIDTRSGNLPKPIRGVIHAVCQPMIKQTDRETVKNVLQTVVFNSLKMANDKWEARSVALPPIGGTVFESDVVATCLLEAILQFNEKRKGNTHLKEVLISCLDWKSYKTIQEFLSQELIKRYSSGKQTDRHKLLMTQRPSRDEGVVHSPPVSPVTPNPPQLNDDDQKVFIVNDNLRVEIYQGNLVKEKADAIVNPANSHLEHDAGAAKAIADAAGPLLIQECQEFILKKRNLPLTQAMHTTSGKLYPDVKHVIHTVGPFWNDRQSQLSAREVTDTFLNTLHYANKLKCQSVSIPAISSGIFGVPVEVVGKAAFDAIILYERTKKPPFYLEEVRLVNIDENTTSSLKKTFEHKVKAQFDSGQVPHVTMVMVDQEASSAVSSDVNPQISSTLGTDSSRRKTERQRSDEGSLLAEGSESELWLKTTEGVNLHLLQGHITEQATTAVVNFVSKSVLRMEGSSKDIHEKAGNEVFLQLQSYVKERGNIKPSQCVATSGGRLKSPHIIHSLLPDGDNEANNNKLINTIINVLSLSNVQLKVPSVAIPFITAGVGNSLESFCDACFEAVLLFSKSAPQRKRRLMDIHLVHPEQKVMKKMGNYFHELLKNQLLVTSIEVVVMKDSLTTAPTLSKPNVTVPSTETKRPDEGFTEHAERVTATDRSRTKQMVLQTDEGLTVIIKQGDILNERNDAIFCPAQKGPLFKRIMQAAGAGPIEELNALKDMLTPGNAIRTSAGRLTPKMRHIIHISYPDSMLMSTVSEGFTSRFFLKKCLWLARDEKSASVALPILQIGSPKEFATAMYKAILDFSDEKKAQITKTITIIDQDDMSVREIQDTFQELVMEQIEHKLYHKSSMVIRDDEDIQKRDTLSPSQDDHVTKSAENTVLRLHKSQQDSHRSHYDEQPRSQSLSLDPSFQYLHHKSPSKQGTRSTGREEDKERMKQPAIMRPLGDNTGGKGKMVSKIKPSSAPSHKEPVRVVRKTTPAPEPEQHPRESRSRQQHRSKEFEISNSPVKPVQRRRSNSLSRTSTTSLGSGFCSSCRTGDKLIKRPLCSHYWCERCCQKNNRCLVKQCAVKR